MSKVQKPSYNEKDNCSKPPLSRKGFPSHLELSAQSNFPLVFSACSASIHESPRMYNGSSKCLSWLLPCFFPCLLASLLTWIYKHKWCKFTFSVCEMFQPANPNPKIPCLLSFLLVGPRSYPFFLRAMFEAANPSPKLTFRNEALHLNSWEYQNWGKWREFSDIYTFLILNALKPLLWR